jgi:putative methionine-R-sulfoxide reductase with GAF domain
MSPLHLLTRKTGACDSPESPQRSEATVCSQFSANLSLLLELVVRGALQKTGAAGAAVAFIEGDTLICRARTGEVAPDLNMAQDTGSGFTGTCVREGRFLNCEDAHTDPRVNATVCQELGIRSILAVPILRDKTVVGIIELLSLRPAAFSAEDVQWLERVTELVRDWVPEPLLKPVENAGQQAIAEPKADQQEAKLADLVQLLQESSPTATWDEIRQRLVSGR